MVENKMVITFLQGFCVLLFIATCKGQINVDKIDNVLNLKINASVIQKVIADNVGSFEKNGMKIDVNQLQNDLIKRFGGTNNTDLNVKVDIDDLRKSIPRVNEFLEPSDIEVNLTEAISKIDDKLKDRKRPCIDFDPPKPDFQSEGHRASQARCLGYIWDIKLEEERVKRSELCRGQSDPIAPHIISGKRAHAGEYPHMGAIGWAAKKDRWIFLCGSSLISHKFVLTVAHCHSLSRHDPRVTYHKPKIVRFGVVNIKTDRHPVDIEIRRFISHPKYNYTLKYYDIALIELEDVVRFTKNIRPACLWNKFSFQNIRTATVTGWGISDRTLNSQTTSPALQVARLDIIDYKQCGDMLRMKESSDWWGMMRHQVCAAKLNGTASACEGDSGGPLQTRLATHTKKSVHSIIGLTSVGFGCGMTRFPSIYTRVSPFIGWIEKEVWGVQEDIENMPKPYSRRHQHYNHFDQKHTFESSSRRNGKHWYHSSYSHDSSHTLSLHT